MAAWDVQQLKLEATSRVTIAKSDATPTPNESVRLIGSKSGQRQPEPDALARFPAPTSIIHQRVFERTGQERQSRSGCRLLAR